MIRVALTFLKGPAANAPAVLRRVRPRPIACTIIRFVISLAAVRPRPTACLRWKRSRAPWAVVARAPAGVPRGNFSSALSKRFGLFHGQIVHDMCYDTRSFSPHPGGRPRYAYSETQ